MSDMALFEEGNSLISKDLFKELTAVDDLLSGGTSVSTIPPRISIKGAKFREMVSGEQTQVRKDDFLNVVIVNAGALSRTYYEGEYDSDNPTPPACWSPDNKKPDAEVENPQAKTCESCPQNVKGSGKGESRACRFNQRIAVLLEGDLDTVYQLQLPATSIFGKDKKGMGMQQYVAFLKSKGAPSIGVITKMYFDEEFDKCSIFYNKFKSVISQIPTEQQIVPIDIPENESDTTKNDNTFFEFEPGESEILDELLPLNFTIQIFKALLESAASEQGARMSAMDNASRNASDMIDNLTLFYNRSRQAVITKELIEIISGAEAV